LAQSKKRLFYYNETVFHTSVKIKPIALFGYKPEARLKAKKLGLKYYRSVKEFFKQNG
jgi:hypothetical protein